MISEYTKNTHAQTHSSYTLEVTEVKKIVKILFNVIYMQIFAV